MRIFLPTRLTCLSLLSFFASLLLSLVTLVSIAAPIPATSSSSFLSSDVGMFRSPLGFEIHSKNTTWIQQTTPEHNSYIKAVYTSPETASGKSPATLTVRVDPLSKAKSATEYIKRWLSEYPRLGFNILGSQKIRVQKNLGFLIDLSEPQSKKQLRQIVFVKNNLAVILTCRDYSETFRDSVKSCNQIAKNFQWF